MILVNTIPNPKSVAPKLQKLQSRKVSINVAHRTNDDERRHQSGKTYSLVEMKFRRDKNFTKSQFQPSNSKRWQDIPS